MNREITQVELGKRLTQVRERAGIKQAELARKVTMSPAVMSRVEAGDRVLAPEELRAILAAINTPEAIKLLELLERTWAVIHRPPLDHPDQELLWEAEEVGKALQALREQPDVRNAFERRLSAYLLEIQQTADLLLKREHQVAFIGSIGIGKSTAISRLTGLEIFKEDSLLPTSVLEAGAGGITICEVHLRTGPQFGILIEPRGDEAIRADVYDFADYLLNGTGAPLGEQSSNGDSQGISKEVERAVRNMSGLKIRRDKAVDGKTTRKDEAKELAQGLGSAREVAVEVLARMELHKRDRRDIWYDAGSGKTELIWLKETFEEINNGRHPQFSLPKRIEVVVPRPLLGTSDLSIRVIDTKGIDRTATRADLEVHLDEPHTVTVLCSGFNNAPAAEARLLLERAKETGVRALRTNSSLLVLPRPNEALAVKDESGLQVGSTDEGYELKGEQVLMSLQHLGLGDLSIQFFNAQEDDPSSLRDFLIRQIGIIRGGFRKRLEAIMANARALLSNQAEEQVQEVMRHAATMLRTWATQNTAVRKSSAHVQDSLMDQIARAYASTIRATVRREGEWGNLSYSHHLGYGARRLAVLSQGKTVEGFSELCKTLVANPEYQEAQDLINQAERVLLAGYEDLLRKVQLMGQTSFRDQLKVDGAFWSQCEDEWGQGPGYRDRVAGHNRSWFEGDSRRELEQELWSLLDREWREALSKLTSLFEID